ncbi:tetratricopeptide repeat protein [Deinococcus roseus]|uniref:Tetratricopeptide repeat protein n=1 Tax=Deinococcus roseus TaxID=392414 RepID=A0ABQ2CSY7_9DEIO|nr:tetratricopeptide repeat protein [Deinococcus roseus]GGJ17931.1 hypothetical protein GCM10008938_00040 [Deinococcus roseus]
MLAKHLMLSLMLSGAAFAQSRGAVSWFHPGSPQDAETAALLSYDMAVNFGLLKPYQTQVFAAPLLTPQGPQLPMDVLYQEGFTEPTLPEHLLVLQDALGVKTVIGGQVKGGEVVLLLRQGDQDQQVTVTADPKNLRTATLKKVAELLKTSLVIPKLAPAALAAPLQDLEKLDLLSAVAPYKDAKDAAVKAFFDTLIAPKNTLDVAYQAILQGPKQLLDLDVKEAPSLVSYQALYLEQNGQTTAALDLLAKSKFPYARTLSEVIAMTRGQELPENWPPEKRGVLTAAQAVILKNTGVTVKDTREALYQFLPHSEYALSEYSFLAFDQNNFQAARTVLERLVSINPNKPLYHTNLGWAQYKTGDALKALLSTNKALQINPEDEIAAYNLGLYNFTLGNDASARQAYDYAFSLGSYKDTQMALADLEESPDPRSHFYSGVLYEQLGNFPKAFQNIKQYMTLTLSASEQENAQGIADRVDQAHCDFELKDQPWFTVKGEAIQQIKQGEFLQANFNVRCSVVLPMPVTVKYTLSQNGEVYSAAEFTPALKPSTLGFRISEPLIPLQEIKEGELKSEIQVTGANGVTKTFTQIFQVQGQATLLERLNSAGLQMVNLYGNPVVNKDPVADLGRQLQTLFQDPVRFKAMYPGLSAEQLVQVQAITPEKIQQVLDQVLARVGADVAPGSKIFFPDVYISYVLQPEAQPAEDQPAAP